MNKDPAVLFYTSDFLIGTSFFTDEQKGQYITLLCLQHQFGHLAQENVLRICKSTDNPVFLKFKKDDSGLLYNERLDNEVKKRANYSESRRQNRFGNHMNRHVKQDMTKDMSPHMENENEIENEDVNESDKSVEKQKKIFVVPTIAAIQEYCLEKGYAIDAERFFDFYESKGWVVGKTKMRDWRAAVRNWNHGSKDRAKPNFDRYKKCMLPVGKE
jgi:hypothetical protein